MIRGRFGRMICSLVGLVTTSVLLVGICVTVYGAEYSTQEPRGLREILRDTDLSLSSLLSQPVDTERVDIVFQFLLGYKGLIERLTQAAHNRDPQTIEVFRDLKQREWRPLFTRLLADLSVRQQHFKWSDQDMDVLCTEILRINKSIDLFKKAVNHLIKN